MSGFSETAYHTTKYLLSSALLYPTHRPIEQSDHSEIKVFLLLKL
jgi:hypothetical protein